MLSKLFTRLNQTQSMTSLATKAFRASPQMNKKPSIGDAVTILQSKVSNINQVVRLQKPIIPNFNSKCALRCRCAFLKDSGGGMQRDFAKQNLDRLFNNYRTT